MPSWPSIFLFDTFLSVTLSESRCIFAFFESFKLFSYFAYPFNFSVMFSLFPYFAPILFCFLVSMCWHIHPLLADGIFFVVLRCPVLSVLFYSILISF